VILATRKSEDVFHEMPFVIIDGDGAKLVIKRMGVLVVVCDQEEEPLAKVVPGFNEKVLTLLTKDEKGAV
jgi:hypothetical protein